MMRLLLAFLLTLNNSLVLKDNAWYSRDLNSAKRLHYYVSVGHHVNVQHMSQAGLFKANNGTKSINAHILYEDCDAPYIVEFQFINSTTNYYTTIWDVEPYTQIMSSSIHALDTQTSPMLECEHEIPDLRHSSLPQSPARD